MKIISILSCLLLSLICISQNSHADQIPQLSQLAEQAGWIFSGVVNAESGEKYGYYYELKREGSHYHVRAALADAVTRNVLFQEDEIAELNEISANDWHIGSAFLKFNPINDTWVMGVRKNDKQGFNFKVDMLTPSGTKVDTKMLRHGLMMIVLQTGELNGHLTMVNSGTQFVTAKHMWFRQIWQTESAKVSALQGLLCQFLDGSSLYSISLQDEHALSGAMASWLNPEGIQVDTSQFVQINSKKNDKGDNAFLVQLASPKVSLKVKDLLAQDALRAGFVEGDQHHGFCVVTKGLG